MKGMNSQGTPIARLTTPVKAKPLVPTAKRPKRENSDGRRDSYDE